MPSSPFRPTVAAIVRAGFVAAAVAMVAGCSMPSGVGETGAVLTGKTRLAALPSPPPAGRTTVQILPYSGLPVTIADSIYRRFRTMALEQKMDIVHRLDEPATWRIQGHFVALANETSAVVIVTYDIYDASGKPVHRIVMQEPASGGTGDYWNGVDGPMQDRLASRSLRVISAWLNEARR